MNLFFEADMTYGSDLYNFIKAFHIVFVVSYFAGIFYMVRLFIYQVDNQKEAEPKREILNTQFIYMQKLLWNIITVPAFTLMLVTGLFILLSNWDYFKTQTWMHIKLSFVLGLIIYQIICWKLLKNQHKNIFKFSSLQLRMWNEVATIILFGVVFAVILKQTFVEKWYCAFGSLLILSISIMLIVKMVKNIRDKSIK